MEKNTQKPIKAEIQDGHLVIDGNLRLNIDGLIELYTFAKPIHFAEKIGDLFCSYAKLCAFMPAIPQRELEQFSQAMPTSESISYLEALASSLKKM